jgi:hypothetical protein
VARERRLARSATAEHEDATHGPMLADQSVVAGEIHGTAASRRSMMPLVADDHSVRTIENDDRDAVLELVRAAFTHDESDGGEEVDSAR